MSEVIYPVLNIWMLGKLIATEHQTTDNGKAKGNQKENAAKFTNVEKSVQVMIYPDHWTLCPFES